MSEYRYFPYFYFLDREIPRFLIVAHLVDAVDHGINDVHPVCSVRFAAALGPGWDIPDFPVREALSDINFTF